MTMKQPLSVSLPVVFLVAGLAGTAFTAAAAPLSFLNDTITARFPAKDLPALRSTIAHVLNHSENNTTTQWDGAHGGPKRAFHVAITPLQTAKTDKAGTCRLLDLQVSQRSASEKWQFWFCQQSDGIWKASGNSVPR